MGDNIPHQNLDSENDTSQETCGTVSKDSLMYRIFGGAKGAFWCVSIDFFGLGTILPLLPFYISLFVRC